MALTGPPLGIETLNTMTDMRRCTPSEFVDLLHDLDRDAIERVAKRLADDRSTAAGDVAWWEDTLCVQSALRAQRASRRAARTAHAACGAVQRAAQADGIELPDEVVTLVARAAADVARALVAGAAGSSESEAAAHRLGSAFESEAPATFAATG